MKTLVIYYSTGSSTEEAALRLAKEFSADTEKISTVEEYPKDNEAMLAQAQKEVESGYTPEIKPLSKNPADYDVIFIGTPTWWYTMAPAVLTLLRSVSFAGKTVLPFQTHVGQPGHVIPDMRKELKGAMVFSGLRLEYDGNKLSPRSETEFTEWTAAVKKEIYK